MLEEVKTRRINIKARKKIVYIIVKASSIPTSLFVKKLK